MPTYDYICKNCGNEFEMFQLMSADPISECPKCHGYVERKIGPGAGLMFKGNGFYITDYKNNNKSHSSEHKSEGSSPKKEKKEAKKS